MAYRSYLQAICDDCCEVGPFGLGEAGVDARARGEGWRIERRDGGIKRFVCPACQRICPECRNGRLIDGPPGSIGLRCERCGYATHGGQG